MPRHPQFLHPGKISRLLGGLWLLAFPLVHPTDAASLTNLQQLSQMLAARQRGTAAVNLEVTVCAASRPQIGVLIVQDDTGTELLQLGALPRDILPGERIRIHRESCLVRKREMGVEISAAPVLNNDGLHAWAGMTNELELRAGNIPVRVDWFNFWRQFGLDVQWASANEPPSSITAARLWHEVVTATGQTNLLPGLWAECYEGTWESIPDFSLFPPTRTGVVTNFDLSTRSRDERVGLRYSGYLEVPRDGRYQFSLFSDDGAMLFLGDLTLSILSLGSTIPPRAQPGALFGANFRNLEERRWTVAEGRVSFVARIGEGVRFDLGNDRQVIAVRVADARELDPATLMNARVRVTGVGRGVMTGDQTLGFGKLFAASASSIVLLEPNLGPGEPAGPITTVAQVQGLPIERARQALPVRIRGIVTGAINSSQERWMSFQDDTRGIFVRLAGISNATPAFGELWEVAGRSGAGDFAPIVVAEQITRLGEGLLPTPIKPTWAELLNGSRDVQWAELTGLVTGLRSNTITLHLPEGRLEVELDGLFESELRAYLKAVVKIRGVLYAVWDAATREVRLGRVMLRNPVLSVDVPAPVNPFDAVLRSPRELLLFDAQASAFRPVKVRGQIVYADATQLFLQADATGLRLLPMGKPDARPGDLVEAVGYPDLGRTELLLREAIIRRTGTAPFPPPQKLEAASPSRESLNATRVSTTGRLLGWHVEESGPVLELQSGNQLFLARMPVAPATGLALRIGSRLAVEGVYVGRHSSAGGESESFELLLNSAADFKIISQPSWWTLPRLLTLLGLLLAGLVGTVIWITQLRRLVEQRTAQLRQETRERERVERQHALETERSRIARDLHDDLGSSLTEISVLASTGQLPPAPDVTPTSLFQAIGNRARRLVSALDVIVWAVDPEDNTLQSLADYLTGYATDFFSHTQIACRFKVPVTCPAINLEGRVRHDLLMAVKEALNNIVRHAAATEVEFRLAWVDDHLEIDIADNGKGIASATSGSGHGLRNLSARLTKLGGGCAVTPRPGGGTIVQIRLPLAAGTIPGAPEGH